MTSGGTEKYVRFNDVVQVKNMSNVRHTVQEIHDILKAYYKVARKRFVDNLCMQGADYHLVTGPDTPLRLFSPTFVGSLTPEQLAQIADEDTAVKKRRVALENKIKELEAAKKILV